MKKFINVSNHPASKWSEEQLLAVKQLGADTIIDLGFPQVDPNLDTTQLKVLSLNLYSNIVSYLADCDKIIVHIMGELGLTTYTVEMLKRNPNIIVVHSTTERIVVEENGVKTSYFKFVRFREYI